MLIYSLNHEKDFSKPSDLGVWHALRGWEVEDQDFVQSELAPALSSQMPAVG
jgi:hypothetical protein